MIAYLDANVVIYLVEQHPTWGPKVASRIRALHGAGDTIATSDASRLECLVGPLITGDTTAMADFATFFADPAVRMLVVNVPVWERAARLRASQSFKPLDALHLAAAIEHGCGLFLTNDFQLQTCTDINVEILI